MMGRPYLRALWLTVAILLASMGLAEQATLPTDGGGAIRSASRIGKCTPDTDGGVCTVAQDKPFEPTLIATGNAELEGGDGPTVRAVYRNPRSEVLLDSGEHVGVLFADDITTSAAEGCNLDGFRFYVSGDPRSDGLGAGPFAVDFALYEVCPGAEASPVPILGTGGSVEFTDNGAYEIVYQVDPTQDVFIPTSFYLGASFSRPHVGIGIGAQTTEGFSSDGLSIPGESCMTTLDGFPEHPHASFAAEVYIREDCAQVYSAYRNTNHSGQPFTPGRYTRFADDIVLATDCALIGYEVAYAPTVVEVDLRESGGLIHRDGPIIPGTRKQFNACFGCEVQKGYVRVDPPIPLYRETPYWIVLRTGSDPPSGIIQTCEQADIGRTSDIFMVHNRNTDQWEPRVGGDGCWGGLDVTVYCAGDPPNGACCDIEHTDEVGEAVCNDVPRMHCPSSARWSENTTCASICVGGEDEGAACTRQADCPGGRCPGPFERPCGVSACCMPDGLCSEVTASDCADLGSPDQRAYYYPGEFCGANGFECPPVGCRGAEGSCMAPNDGLCVGGSSDGTPCDPTLPCEASECCTGAGTCKSSPGCDSATCCSAVCSLPAQAYCCEIHWDAHCTTAAMSVCVQRPKNDECAGSGSTDGAMLIDVPSLTLGDTVLATENGSDPGICCVDGSGGTGTLWYRFTAPPAARDETTSSVLLSTCPRGDDSSNEGHDSVLQVFEGADSNRGRCSNGIACQIGIEACADGSECRADDRNACDSLVPIACNDDAESLCGVDGYAETCATDLIPGRTYYVVLSAKSEADRGEYELLAVPHCEPVASSTQPDCDADGTPDVCELPPYDAFGDCDQNATPDECDPDCNENGLPDACDLPPIGDGLDCDGNSVPDECDPDCDFDAVPDACQMPPFTETGDCNEDGIYDGCQLDEIEQIAEMYAGEPIYDGRFGESVAIDGNRAVISAPHSFGIDVYSRAYILQRSEGRWAIAALLSPSPRDGYSSFGWAVALDGTTAIVSAPYEQFDGVSVGAVYFYRLANEDWIQTAKLTASDRSTSSSFGVSVALDGNMAVVGAERNSDVEFHAGSAYVFRRLGNRWIEEAKLQASDPQPSAYFGNSVAILEDTIVVGAFGSGSVYVYRHLHDTWQESQELKAEDFGGSDEFGRWLALDQNRLAVTGVHSAVYPWHDGVGIFRWQGDEFVLEARLDASHAPLALGGDTLLVGNGGWFGNAVSPVSVFRLKRNTWRPVTTLYGSGEFPGDSFGHAVGISGNTALIGAPLSDGPPDDPVRDSGAVYEFDLRVNDCNADGVHNACDGDSDEDGWLDSCDNCPDQPNSAQIDTDRDGQGDLCDRCTDFDGDGFGDPGFPLNTCPEDPCPDGYNDVDSDGDRVCDLFDNCPDRFNPLQGDVDHDHLGDACDSDCGPEQSAIVFSESFPEYAVIDPDRWESFPEDYYVGSDCSSYPDLSLRIDPPATLVSRSFDLFATSGATLRANISYRDLSSGTLTIEYSTGSGWARLLELDTVTRTEQFRHTRDLPRDALRDDVQLRIHIEGDDWWCIDEIEVNATYGDCNANGALDVCDLASGAADDCNENGFPDECDFDFFQLGTREDYDVGERPQSLATGDFDQDGDVDLLVGRGYFSGRSWVTTMLNRGDGFFDIGHEIVPRRFHGTWARSLATGDLDRDGDVDGVLAAGDVYLLQNYGGRWRGFESGWLFELPSLDVPGRAQAVALGDLDKDGDLDIVTAAGALFNPLGRAVIFLNNGDATFIESSSIVTGDTPRSIVLFDADNDGDLEIAVVNQFDSTLSIAQNNGINNMGAWQGFGSVERTYLGGNPFFVVSEDFDADGDADLAVALSGSATVSILLNEGRDVNGNWQGFGTTLDFPVGLSPMALSSADLNADGLPDLVVGNGDNASISILLNAGASTAGQWLGFLGGVEREVGPRPVNIAAADFNGDGHPDLAVAIRASGNSDEPIGDPSLSVFLSVPSSTTDCNANAAPDDCELSDGVLSDCDLDRLADACEPDCNANGVADDCDLAGGSSTDCNRNGIPDECDMVAGVSQDCDADAVMDVCEVEQIFQIKSDHLTPFHLAVPQYFALQSPPRTASDVAITVTVSASLRGQEKHVDVSLNGALLARLFQDDGTTCGGYPEYDEDVAQIVVDVDTFNRALNETGGDITLELTTTATASCPANRHTLRATEPYVRVQIEYVTQGRPDADRDGIPDICESPTLDVRPDSCPNPLNTKSKGVLPVALLGKALFDVSQIDLESITLSRADGVGGSVTPLRRKHGSLRVSFDDVAARILDAEPCACREAGPDGIDDLILKFSMPALVQALEMRDFDGEAVPMLTISGTLTDGTSFSASDCVTLVGPLEAQPAAPLRPR